MLTLKQLNEKAEGTRWTWSNAFVLERRYYVGRKGGTKYRGRTGDKVHLLEGSLIIEDVRTEKRSSAYAVGQLFSSRGCCGGGNGQHTAHIVESYETADVTCTNCLKVLEYFAAK